MYFLCYLCEKLPSSYSRVLNQAGVLEFHRGTHTHTLFCSIPMSDGTHLPPAICNYFLPVSKIFMDTSKINIHFLPLFSGSVQDDNTTKPPARRGFKLSIRLPFFFKSSQSRIGPCTWKCVERMLKTKWMILTWKNANYSLSFRRTPLGPEQPVPEAGPTNTPKHLVI